MATVYVGTNAAKVASRMNERALLVTTFVKAAPEELAGIAEEIVTPILAEETPKDTGELELSQSPHIRMEFGEVALVYESDAPYAEFVLDGTGIYHRPDPHQEWDVYGLQVFTAGGAMIFTRHTHHYGQEPNDYPDRTLLRAAAPIAVAVRALAGRLFVSFF